MVECKVGQSNLGQWMTFHTLMPSNRFQVLNLAFWKGFGQKQPKKLPFWHSLYIYFLLLASNGRKLIKYIYPIPVLIYCGQKKNKEGMGEGKGRKGIVFLIKSTIFIGYLVVRNVAQINIGEVVKNRIIIEHFGPLKMTNN